VRYGNVVGSRGSVVPFFHKIIADGTRTLPITDERMTRFWITLQQGVDFVMRSFERMHGGEIFVPRIPSSRIVDLAEAIAPGMKREIVGIRPGEKLHEIMCPSDDARLTLEFEDHYVIQPSITFYEHPEYRTNAVGEAGAAVDPEFEYNSGTNPHFLSVPEIRVLLAATA
jgi:UDP-N-acetylglucosamine 4,6-dehydratase